MIEGLHELCALIERNRDRAEDTAQLVPEVREAAGRAGMWALVAPKDVGGLELSLPELLRAFERLGQADATVAWHAANSVATGLAAYRLDDANRDLVFAELDRPFGYAGAVAAGVRATRVDGGFRVDGRWPFMTGAADARWAATTVMVVDADGTASTPPEIRRFVLPLDELQVQPTWQDASGMRGTGSHAVSADGVFVPASRALLLDAPLRIDRPMGRTPDGVVFFAPCGAMAAGILRSATAGVIELVSAKVSRFDGHAHYDDARVQQTVADATSAAEMISAGLQQVATDYWQASVEGRPASVEVRQRLWSVLFHSFDVARRHISDLYAVGTSSTYATRNPIDRALRDIHAINATFDSLQSLRRAAGRSLLGHDAGHPRF